MMKMVYLIMAYLLFCSCSDDENTPEVLQPGEITITLSNLPEGAVNIGESSTFTFKASQENSNKDFVIDIDTVGTFDLLINGEDFSLINKITPGQNYNVSFVPQMPGTCKINLNITNGERVGKKSIQIIAESREFSIDFSPIPDSISVFDELNINFKINGQSNENYSLEIDTIIPIFRYFRRTELRRGVELLINDEAENKADIVEGKQNSFTFKNPQVVGDYKIIFFFTDKYGKEKRIEKIIKVVSPEVIIKFYEIDPWLDLKIYEKDQFYPELNKMLTYSPLSEVLKGTRTDTIYSKMVETNLPTPGSFTIPGRGITMYIFQEGGNDFIFQGDGDSEAIPGIKYDINTYALSPDWNNAGRWNIFFKPGFQCLEFNTNSLNNRIGTTTYTYTFYDIWGKPTSADLTMVVLEYDGKDLNYWHDHTGKYADYPIGNRLPD